MDTTPTRSHGNCNRPTIPSQSVQTRPLQTGKIALDHQFADCAEKIAHANPRSRGVEGEEGQSRRGTQLWHIVNTLTQGSC